MNMSLLESLKESPGRLPRSSKFIVQNGIIYMGAGALILIWPGAVQVLMFAPEFVGRESALIRVLGMTVMIIGWFYFFGGRSGGKQIVAASVLNRIILVPIVLIPLAMGGVFPGFLGAFAVLDPALGLAAWYLLERDTQSKTQDNSQTKGRH